MLADGVMVEAYDLSTEEAELSLWAMYQVPASQDYDKTLSLKKKKERKCQIWWHMSGIQALGGRGKRITCPRPT